MSDLLGKVPPCDLEAEQGLLAAILERPTILASVMNFVASEDFYGPRNARVFAACVRLFAENTPIDGITLIDALRRTGDLTAVTTRYVAELAAHLGFPTHAEAYAHTIRDIALRRDLGQAAYQIANDSFDATDAAEFFTKAQTALSRIYARQVPDGPSFSETLGDVFADIDRPLGAGNFKTGLSGLDDALSGGLSAGDLVIVAAQTGQGKTSLGLNIAASFAKRDDGALYASLEMSERKLVRRLLFAEAQVSMTRAISGVSDAERRQLENARRTFADRPLRIVYAPGLTPSKLRAAAERFRLESSAPLRLIIADYVGLMRSDRREERREREVAAITRDLKLLAGDLNCAVIACAQFNREVDKRGGSIPRLADLRDSGAIEQDADVVLFIYHDPKQPPPNDAVLIIAKNRDGAECQIPVRHIKSQTRFEERCR
jgi:replicative DNA helicase